MSKPLITITANTDPDDADSIIANMQVADELNAAQALLLVGQLSRMVTQLGQRLADGCSIDRTTANRILQHGRET